MPGLGAEGPPLGGKEGAVHTLDFRRVGPDPESAANRLLEVVLGRPEAFAEDTSMLDRMRQITQVRLGGVVHQGSEGILCVSVALLNQARDDHRVLGHGVEDAAMPAEAAQVGQRAGDITDIELVRIRVEGVNPAARHSLQVRAGGRRGAIGLGHATYGA